MARAGFVAAEPRDLHHAMTDPLWREAMHQEFDALQKSGTWQLVLRKSGVNVIDSSSR
jgi:hypothetical protein